MIFLRTATAARGCCTAFTNKAEGFRDGIGRRSLATATGASVDGCSASHQQNSCTGESEITLLAILQRADRRRRRKSPHAPGYPLFRFFLLISSTSFLVLILPDTHALEPGFDVSGGESADYLRPSPSDMEYAAATMMENARPSGLKKPSKLPAFNGTMTRTLLQETTASDLNSRLTGQVMNLQQPLVNVSTNKHKITGCSWKSSGIYNGLVKEC
jgi:kinesin family protein C1